MKQRLIYILLAVLLPALYACREKVGPVPVKPEDNVYIDTLVCVGGEASTCRFYFFSLNTWKAAVDGAPEWCTVTPNEGGSGGAALEVRLAGNYDSESRTATVRITSDTKTGTIVVRQERLDILDLTSVDKSAFEAPGGSFVINVDANISYDYKIDSPWIECTKTKALTSDRLHFTVGKNYEGVDRVAKIRFSGNGLEREVTITQRPAILDCGTRDTLVPQAGSTTSVRVRSTVSYEMVMPQLQCLKLAESSSNEVTADGVETINLYGFVLDANNEYCSRECHVIFCNSEYNVADTLTLIQERVDLFASSPEPLVDFSPDSVSFTVDFDAGRQFDCDAGCDWITLETPEARPYRRIIHVNQNRSGADRSCRIALADAGGAKAIDIFQKRIEMDYSYRIFNFSAEGGTDTLFFSHNIDCSHELPEEEWCGINEEAPGVFVMSVAENPEENPRSCSMVFTSTYYQVADTIVVRQEQKDVMRVFPQMIQVPAEGEEVEVRVHANIPYDYVIEDNPEWIRENLDSSSDSVRTLVFSVSGNTSGRERVGRIVFTYGKFSTDVTVIQDAAFISIPDTLYYISGAGGSKEIAIGSNIPFSVSPSGQTWLSHKVSDGAGVEVTAAANDSSEGREGRFVIGNDGYGISHEIIVIQAPAGSILDAGSIDFGPEGGKTSVKVYAGDYSYSVDGSPDWIRDEGGLTFAVDTNFTGDPRECVIRFVTEDASDSLKVVQSAFFLEVTPKSLDDMDSCGGQMSFAVRSNAAFTVTASDWITVSVNDDTVLLDVAENIGYDKRECEVTVTSEHGMSRSLIFMQDFRVPHPPFKAKQDTFEAPPAGGEVVVETTPSEGASYNEQQLPLYVLEDKDRRNDSTFVFVVGKADVYREWVVSLKDVYGQVIALRFMQSPASLTLSSSSRLFMATGGESKLTVSSNFAYQIYMPDDQPWVSYRKGAGEHDYYFAAAPNDTGRERTASVVIGDTLIGVTRTLEIVQKENIYLEVAPPLLKCDWNGGGLFVDVRSNADISVKSDLQGSEVKWFDIVQTDPPGRYMVTVDTNYKFQSRASTITFSAGGQVKTVNISQNGFRREGLYYSEDFSADRSAKTIQEASKGRGINIVLMGDGFSDRQIASGTYDSLMNVAVRCFFDIEPYRSFRDLFNIYSVTVVSPTDVYVEDAAKALSTHFGPSTQVGGDDDMVKYYARAAVTEKELQDAVIVVLVNSPVYAGTTYLTYDTEQVTDYGCGCAVSYVPLCTSPEQFCQVLQHEVGGHAFGKLEDEYSYERNGAIPYEEIVNYRSAQRMGYYKNVDFVADSAAVRWSRFLYDERYADDGLGVFEGACTYWTGAFRSTQDGMMRHNTGCFNAPSREAIYYRMFRLAYGDDAEYDLESFVEYDAVNRIPPTKSALQRNVSAAAPSGFVPLAHPVVIEN